MTRRCPDGCELSPLPHRHGETPEDACRSRLGDRFETVEALIPAGLDRRGVGQALEKHGKKDSPIQRAISKLEERERERLAVYGILAVALKAQSTAASAQEWKAGREDREAARDAIARAVGRLRRATPGHEPSEMERRAEELLTLRDRLAKQTGTISIGIAELFDPGKRDVWRDRVRRRGRKGRPKLTYRDDAENALRALGLKAEDVAAILEAAGLVGTSPRKHGEKMP